MADGTGTGRSMGFYVVVTLVVLMVALLVYLLIGAFTGVPPEVQSPEVPVRFDTIQ